jgi:hypothetical protein
MFTSTFAEPSAQAEGEPENRYPEAPWGKLAVRDMHVRLTLYISLVQKTYVAQSGGGVAPPPFFGLIAWL